MAANEETETIDGYIAGYPADIQQILQQLRQIIREEAPAATEAIKYGIPTFVLHGNLVHFAAHKQHIGFYPTPSGLEAFQEELAGYAMSTGAVRFPLDEPLPYELIRRMVAFRVQENLARATAKKKKG